MEISGDSEAISFATENGLTLIGSPQIHGDIVFLECAATASLADFYTWAEVSRDAKPMREVWRPFLWTRGDDIGLAAPLQEIQLGPDATLHTAAALCINHGLETKRV